MNQPPRLNRAGIPVLDPPGRNGLPKQCASEDHDWGPPSKLSGRWISDWMDDSGGYVLSVYEQRCRRCGEHVRYKRRS